MKRGLVGFLIAGLEVEDRDGGTSRVSNDAAGRIWESHMALTLILCFRQSPQPIAGAQFRLLAAACFLDSDSGP